MSENLLKESVELIQNEGVVEFSQRSTRFVCGYCLDKILSSNIDKIDCLSVQKTQVEQSDTVIITYNKESNLPALLSRLENEIAVPQRDILEFRSARLLGRPPLVNIGLAKNFHIDSVGNSRKTFSSLEHPLQKLLQDIIVQKLRVDKHLDLGFVVGGSRGMGGFAGWFYEQLPKLYWYEKYCKVTESNPELIVSGELSDINTRSLELVGYPASDYTHHQRPQVIGIDRLLIPPHPYRTRGGEFQVCPSAIQWVRDRILSNISSGSTTFPNRVYISRADADRRQVINEHEVVSLLNKYGFESFEPGRLTFDNQVRLFANADIIVGPHGAGLTNMIYSKDAKILELMTEESGEHFFVLANECNHTYELLCCESMGNENIHPRYNDMYVDVCSLENKLQCMIRN